MIQHVWSVLCRGTSTDRDSNNITIFGVVDGFTVAPLHEAMAKPAPGVPFFEFVSVWCSVGEDAKPRGRAKLDVVSPSGVAIPISEFDVDLSDANRARTITRMAGFPAKSSGLYRMRVSLRYSESDEWREVASIPVDVELPSPPSPPPSPSIN